MGAANNRSYTASEMGESLRITKLTLLTATTAPATASTETISLVGKTTRCKRPWTRFQVASARTRTAAFSRSSLQRIPWLARRLSKFPRMLARMEDGSRNFLAACRLPIDMVYCLFSTPWVLFLCRRHGQGCSRSL
jgi:hypothetical protein